MNLYDIHHRYTRYVRVPDGPMDSKFSHTEIDEAHLRVIAPSEKWARFYAENSAGHADDKAFKIISVTETQVHAIIGINSGLGFITRR